MTNPEKIAKLNEIISGLNDWQWQLYQMESELPNHTDTIEEAGLEIDQAKIKILNIIHSIKKIKQ